MTMSRDDWATQVNRISKDLRLPRDAIDDDHDKTLRTADYVVMAAILLGLVSLSASSYWAKSGSNTEPTAVLETALISNSKLVPAPASPTAFDARAPRLLQR